MSRLLALTTIFAALAIPASAADPAPTPDCHGIQVTDKAGDSHNTLPGAEGQAGSPSSDLIAAEVWERAFSSRIWPNKVSEMMTAAASKYTATRPSVTNVAGKTCGASVATTL